MSSNNYYVTGNKFSIKINFKLYILKPKGILENILHFFNIKEKVLHFNVEGHSLFCQKIDAFVLPGQYINAEDFWDNMTRISIIYMKDPYYRGIFHIKDNNMDIHPRKLSGVALDIYNTTKRNLKIEFQMDNCHNFGMDTVAIDPFSNIKSLKRNANWDLWTAVHYLTQEKFCKKIEKVEFSNGKTPEYCVREKIVINNPKSNHLFLNDNAFFGESFVVDGDPNFKYEYVTCQNNRYNAIFLEAKQKGAWYSMIVNNPKRFSISPTSIISLYTEDVYNNMKKMGFNLEGQEYYYMDDIKLNETSKKAGKDESDIKVGQRFVIIDYTPEMKAIIQGNPKKYNWAATNNFYPNLMPGMKFDLNKLDSTYLKDNFRKDIWIGVIIGGSGSKYAKIGAHCGVIFNLYDLLFYNKDTSSNPVTKCEGRFFVSGEVGLGIGAGVDVIAGIVVFKGYNRQEILKTQWKFGVSLDVSIGAKIPFKLMNTISFKAVDDIILYLYRIWKTQWTSRIAGKAGKGAIRLAEKAENELKNRLVKLVSWTIDSNSKDEDTAIHIIDFAPGAELWLGAKLQAFEVFDTPVITDTYQKSIEEMMRVRDRNKRNHINWSKNLKKKVTGK